MNLLVTGGCGFIGSNFIRQRLLEPGSPLAKLVNLDALTYAGNPANLADLAADPRYVFAHGDIGDATLVARLLAEHQIDAVVNFAAESHVDRSIDSPEPFVQTNVVGTLRLLNAARLYWTKLPEPKKSAFRFLHVSTDEVYGTLAPDDPAYTEETPFAPNSPYAASKAALAALTKSIARGWGKRGVAAFCVAPGFTRTEMAQDFIDQYGETYVTGDLALPHMTEPQDIAPAVVFLASGLADHATGQTLDLNAGSYVR